MKGIVMGVLGIMVLVGGGCAIGPYTPMKSKNLDGAKLIYFEQADRIPKDVMLSAWNHQPVVPPVVVGNFKVSTNSVGLTPEEIAALIQAILAQIPSITAGYQNERTNEALLSRRMLFRGYQDAELKDINEIVKSLGWSIEYMTPQNKTVPPPVAK